MKILDEATLRQGTPQQIIAEIRQANSNDPYISQMTADMYAEEINKFCPSLVNSALRAEIEKISDKCEKAVAYLAHTSPRFFILP